MNWQEWEEAAKDEARWHNHEEEGLLKAEYIKDYDEQAIDIAPECIRFFCERYGRRVNARRTPSERKVGKKKLPIQKVEQPIELERIIG